MLIDLVFLVGGYLLACAIAYGLHEGAHYAVHSLAAEKVEVGTTKYAPYVDAWYSPDAPTALMRLGSIAPTLFYTPLVAMGIVAYLQRYSLPDLTPTVWTMVWVPILILVFPTAGDRRGFLDP